MALFLKISRAAPPVEAIGSNLAVGCSLQNIRYSISTPLHSSDEYGRSEWFASDHLAPHFQKTGVAVALHSRYCHDSFKCPIVFGHEPLEIAGLVKAHSICAGYSDALRDDSDQWSDRGVAPPNQTSTGQNDSCERDHCVANGNDISRFMIFRVPSWIGDTGGKKNCGYHRVGNLRPTSVMRIAFTGRNWSSHSR